MFNLISKCTYRIFIRMSEFFLLYFRMGAKYLQPHVIKLPKCGTSIVTRRYRLHSTMLLSKQYIGSKHQTTAVWWLGAGIRPWSFGIHDHQILWWCYSSLKGVTVLTWYGISSFLWYLKLEDNVKALQTLIIDVGCNLDCLSCRKPRFLYCICSRTTENWMSHFFSHLLCEHIQSQAMPAPVWCVQYKNWQ